MSTQTFGFLGNISLWLGIAVCAATLLLVLSASAGFSDTELSRGHDSYYVLLGWKQLMFLLSPIAAGVILIITGLQIKKQAVQLREGVKKISETWNP